MEFLTAALSKPGGRKNNEDFCSFHSHSNGNVWVVADGMGGHHGGEIASKLAVESIKDSFIQNPKVQEENMRSLITQANQAILEQQQSHVDLQNMQTTVVMLATSGDSCVTAHVGDTRCYRLKNGKIVNQTKDHSVVQILVNQGEIGEKEMRHHEDRNKVLRSLGNQEMVRPTIHVFEEVVGIGDAFLLCSDGFWEYVWEAEMEVDYYKSSNPSEWLKRMESRLLNRATGTHDNYTAIAVFVK
jgi:PPM family protein phosphatase